MYRALLVTGVFWLAGLGCAMSPPADTSPDVDPSLPGVDVGNDPTPVPGAKNAEAGSSASSGSSGSSGDSGNSGNDGKQGLAPEGGAPATAPSVTKAAAGDVLLTEVMYDTLTPEPVSEWFELHSTVASERSLSGFTIKDGAGRTHTIGALTIAPGAYIVLARNKAGAISAKVPSGAIAYDYGTGLPDNAGVLLTNGATGTVVLLDGATTIASAPYGGWYSQSGGSSVQLKVLDPATASAKASWCLSLTAWTTGSGKGTPGAPGDCP